MATEDEAREAADEKEIQVEAVDLGTDHLQTHPEDKLSSAMEIKNVGEIIDSTEGMLKIPEDQVLVEAPSEVKLPQEQNPNGTSSCLNGHMDKEEKISNEHMHENNQEEAELDGTSTDQSNRINKEDATDCLSHGESTTEDRSLLKHEEEKEPKGDDQHDSEGAIVDDDSLQEDTLKTGNALWQTLDDQQDQDLEPAEATEDTQPASTADITDVEVVAEAPAGIQTPVEPNLEDSDAVPNTTDGKTETDEPAKADGVVHLDHKESFPEDTSIAEPTEEVVKVEDQQSQQPDEMDADVVQEDMLKCEETDMQEEAPKSEHADESTTDAQEVLNQESAEETNGLVNEKTEETEHQSTMAAPEETTPEHDATREPAAYIQGQNLESLEEIEEASEVHTEAAMQQRSVAFEEAIPEYQHNLGVTMDDDTVQEDTLNAIEQTDDRQQDQDLEPAKATEDTQTATMADIPNVEVVDEAPSGVQTPMEPNVDISDAVPRTIGGNTETDEPAKADSVIHLDRKGSVPEDTSIAEHTEEEVLKVERQQSQQADAMDADVVQEEMLKCEKTDVQEEMLISEHADESAADAQEVLNQESAEETNGLVHEKTEESTHQSKMASSEETTSEHDATTREPDINIQEQNQESLEEIADAEAVDTEAEMQQSSVAFEEAIPEDHLATTEPCSDTQYVHNVEPEEINDPGDVNDKEITNKINSENAVQDNIIPSEPTTDIQPVQELEQTDTNSNGTYEMDEASDQTHAVVFNDLSQEYAIAASEPQVTETEEPKDIEATETQEITKHGHVTPSKELSAEDDSTANEPHNDDFQQILEQDPVKVKDTETHHANTISTSEEDRAEDNVTAAGPIRDSEEVDNVESTEEIKENIAENIEEISSVAIVDEADEGKNVPRAEGIAEKRMQELEPEDTNNTEPVETDEDSDQRHADLFDDSAQEDNTPASEKQQAVSALEMKEIEATKTEATPQEIDACVSKEPSPEDNCDTQEVNIVESSEVIEGDKDILTGEISDQSNMVFAGESAQENNVPESETTADIQPVQEPESEEIKDTELVEMSETSREMNATVFQMPTQEDNPTTIELHAMESAEVSNIEATEAQGAPHQSNADQSEEQATEENITASEPQILEPESLEEMNDTEATEPQSISQQSISTSEESIREEISTEDNVITEPDVNHQQLQDKKSAEFKEIEADKPQGIDSSSTVSTTSEDNATATEPSSDIQAENLQSAEVIEDNENSKSNTALAEEAAPKEHVGTEATADISPVQEPDLEEIKHTEPVGTEDNMTSSKLTAEDMDMETMETEAIPRECHVASIKELTEDDILTSNAPHADIEPVLEQESVEDMKCTVTTEYPGGPKKLIGSTSGEPTPTEENITVTEPALDTQMQNLTSQEIKNREDDITDQLPDHSSFPTPEEADQESNLPRIELTSDVQRVQELDSAEATRGIEALKTEDHQQHRVSTLEEPAVDSEPSVDNQQVNEDILPEIKDNIATPDNSAEERSELENDSDSNVQLTQEVELSRDSENSQPVKAEETSSQSNDTALEEKTTEGSVASKIDPPVDIKQEHEQEPVEETKGIDATEAEEDFHTSQADAIEKSASKNNIATIEPNYDIQQANDLEATKDMKDIEAINDEQTEIETSEDPSRTDNGTTTEEHPVESNEEKMGNKTDNAILAHGIKDEMQTSTELKDDACDLDETVLTTQKSENRTDEDAGQRFTDNTLETSNKIHQVKEDQKAGTEHNSSQMSSEQNRENITHVQDRDIKGDFLPERGTAEALQALFESDPQAPQDASEKDDTIKGGEQTSDHDIRQPGDVAFQLQTCEADASSIDKQDEAVQKVDWDQKQKEDEEIESQKEELQADEHKNEDKMDDFTTEPLVEPQNIKNGIANRTEETDAFEAEQTEAVITEIAKNGQALHVSKESTPSITDIKVENVEAIYEGTEEDADAENDNNDEQENADKDDVVAQISTDKQDQTTDEITNEELEPGLASSVQEASDPAPSNDQILENDPVAITQNVESGVHREYKECTNKVNDDVHAIQASEKEIADEIEENKEMQNEDNAIYHDECQAKPEEEEAPQLHSNEPYKMDTKIDDTTTPCEEIIHDNTSIQPREIEEIGENKGLDSIPKPFVESSIQNNVDQDLSSHHKVGDEKLSTTVKNAVDTEAMQEKIDESASDINQTRQCQEEIDADDDVQLETEENSFDKIDGTVSNEKAETSNTAATEAVAINEDITDKASEADGALSDESPKTFNDTRRDLDVSSGITASKEESMKENMEDHKIALPAHPAQDENTPKRALCLEETEREMSSSDKLLPTEPEENQTPNEQDEEGIQDENRIRNEQNEEDMQETEIGDAQKEVEQELPVSHFLMNLILGKENGDANENSESEAERKQETTEDNSCLFISKKEESLVSVPIENKVDDKRTFEQEKDDVKCSEETQEMVKEQSPDLKLDTERTIENDEEFNKNTHDLDIPAYQDNSQGEISGELFSEEAASIATKIEPRDIEISNVELDDRADDTIYQENAEASTEVENGSLKNLNDLTNTKASEEDTLGEGQTGLLCEPLPEDKSADAVSEQTPLLTESGMTDAKDFPSDVKSDQNPVCAKQDDPTEYSNIKATTTPDIQLDSEAVDKKEEKQHASTSTGEVSEERVERSHDNLQKSTSSEATSDEQAPQITEPISDTEMTLAQEKEISEGSTCLDEKGNSNFSIKGVDNFQTAVEIQADGPNMQINQDKQDEAADNETATEPEKLGESNFQEHQETGTEQKPPKESDEGHQQFLDKKEIMTKEQDVHETIESHKQTASIKSNEEQELFDSKVQERDLNVVSPKEAPEPEENYVDVTKPEFSTDEEQSPKAEESKMAGEITYDEKTKDTEDTKNFTDEAAMKTEARGAAQKAAHKKHSLLSGVGSKVKHQLAKVKKAIVGKPGHTKPESPKS